MALARCRRCGKPDGRTRQYVRATEPIGYPETAAICGTAGCDQPAVVWLDEHDDAEYRIGQRVFEFPNRAMKVRVA